MVLGHELLLLVHAAGAAEREEEAGHHIALLALSLDHLPACSRDTLEHTVHSTKDTIALEHLAWAIYDNQLGPGKSPSLSGYESYGQVLQCLVDRAFRGLQVRCPGMYLSRVQTSRKSEVGSHCATEVTHGLRSSP